MHKKRNEKASAIFQGNSACLITKTQHIIDNTTLSFQVKFRCAICLKGPRIWNRFNSEFEKAIANFLYFKKKAKLSKTHNITLSKGFF